MRKVMIVKYSKSHDNEGFRDDLWRRGYLVTSQLSMIYSPLTLPENGGSYTCPTFSLLLSIQKRLFIVFRSPIIRIWTYEFYALHVRECFRTADRLKCSCELRQVLLNSDWRRYLKAETWEPELPTSLVSMAPDASFLSAQSQNGNKTQQRSRLRYSGSLDNHRAFDVTSVIGREFPELQLSDLLNANNSDEVLRDLAITVSERGVVFFRNQNINLEQQKVLVQKLGELAGKPESSKLHVHPLFNSPDNSPVNAAGDQDPYVYTVSSKSQAKLYKTMQHRMTVAPASVGWHSDLTFENIPSDYACLKIHTTPETGGDTLWASGYEVYDRISPGMREYLCTLSATHAQPVFKRSATDGNFPIYSPRGSPENVGDEFSALHPVVRTNPVTGWRSIYAVGLHLKQIEGVTPQENKILRDYFEFLITHNHDLQVRFKWNPGDVAIWDNRSVYHTATPDLNGLREGNRTTSLGERPYFDPASISRRESLIAETK